jgi:hypothetical protein
MLLKIKSPFVAALTLALALGGSAFAQVIGVSINIAPPVLPVYEQPPVPAPGYIWTPGYWAETDGDYYWVPGTWVEPPQVGLLWTPGYWAASGDGFVWNAGYWAPEIGFYGGVNYGFGYGGVGFEGGHWDNGQFFYNRTVTNVSDTHITNVYEKTVVNNVTANNVSFNGGKGGTTAHPTAHELAVAHESHVAPTAAQVEQQHTASTNKQLFASVNHGRPAIAASQKPGVFSGAGVVAARNAERPVRTSERSDTTAGRTPERSNTNATRGAQPSEARPARPPAPRSVAPRQGEAPKPNKESTREPSHPPAPRPDRPAEPPKEGREQKPPGGP